MKKGILLFFIIIPVFVWAQESADEDQYDKSRYENTEFYNVKDYTSKKSKSQQPKNIIFLIGDGMGTA